MEDLIEQYLLQYKYCPLPAIGVLERKTVSAVSIQSENRILAPVHQISFSAKEKDATHFIRFIAARKNISYDAAYDALHHYCRNLMQMDTLQEARLEHSGRFFIDPSGKLCFVQAVLPSVFMPDVVIERVLRPNAIHQVRVGDTETNSVAMTEFLNDNGEERKGKWWIWAIVLFILACVAIFMYAGHPLRGHNFGTVEKIVPAPAGNTYQPVN